MSLFMLDNGVSDTWSAQAGGSVTIFGWNMGANLGISYNNKTGTVLNYGTHGGYGEMTVGIYPEDMSVFHEEGVKMWMAPKGDEPFYFEQNSNGEKHVFMSSIPSIEGVFYEDDGNHDGLHNSVQGSASYNYGNNLITHLWLDIVPWKVMDCLF